jgi:hypothetical protein
MADDSPERSSRDALYEQLAVDLLNAGLVVPAADFVAQVRALAGFRAAPRQITAVVQELTRTMQPVTAEAVARIVGELRGYSSSRQRRHADQWRALGSALAARGLDGSPSGQRAFVGQSRAVAGQPLADATLLAIAMTVAEVGRALDPETVGEIGKRLGRRVDGLTADDIAALTRAELRDLGRERAAAGRPKSRSSSAKRRPKVKPPPGPNFNTRKWRPGGRRRRALVPRKPEKLE